jgi:peptidylprolyl isomerase
MTQSQNTKPEIDAPEGPAPSELQIVDITVGEGDEAQASSTVNVHYLGVSYDTGDEFDSSWSRGELPALQPHPRLARGYPRHEGRRTA